MEKVIPIDPGEIQETVIRAGRTLLSGGLVAYPTESFYGLGAHINLDTALKKLFEIKSRASGHPVLILIPDKKAIEPYVSQISPVAERLMNAFWPGGLTIVFKATSLVSPLLTAGTGKIGIRLSSHPMATALSRATGSPITGTSANISGESPCRTAKGVIRSLGDKVDLVLDGGKTRGEKASTILDVTLNPPRILREGMISKEQLEPYF
jgi:L-threonylcarbamoyladenylate synthase